MIALFHAVMVNFDIGLRSAETGIMGSCRSTQLAQELGLIEYVFSDKTGTLTKNKMTFKACVVGQHVYVAGWLAGSITVCLSVYLSVLVRPRMDGWMR